MKREEAKQLLELCRPGHHGQHGHRGHEEDRQDPALGEAFALLDTDAELNAWFEAQQAIDSRISERLHAIEVPADLEASILAGMRLHKAHRTQSESAPIPFATETDRSAESGRSGETDESGRSGETNESGRSGETNESGERLPNSRPWWQSPWIGLAALFLIAAVVLNLPRSDPSASSGDQEATFGQLSQLSQLGQPPRAAVADRTAQPAQTVMAGLPPVLKFLSGQIDRLQPEHFSKRDDRAENLQAFLVSTQAPSPRTIPDCLGKMATIGCITFEFEGSQLSMICFKDGEIYHLITANKSTYPDGLPAQPQIFECLNKSFKIWVDGEQVKILAVTGAKENIPEFI
jgi:hypothetical protein